MKENDTFDYNWDEDTLNANGAEQKASLKPKLSNKLSKNGTKANYENIERPYQEKTEYINSICDGNLNSVR